MPYIIIYLLEYPIIIAYTLRYRIGSTKQLFRLCLCLVQSFIQCVLEYPIERPKHALHALCRPYRISSAIPCRLTYRIPPVSDTVWVPHRTSLRKSYRRPCRIPLECTIECLSEYFRDNGLMRGKSGAECSQWGSQEQ